MNKSKIILLSTLAVLSLTACSSKSETESLPEPTATPVATSTPIPTATPIPDNHDFDTEINDFKDENNIEINSSDDGTDIADHFATSGDGSDGLTTLHDWLYNNGVTRESVQNDRDSGCENPYLEGYLEYLDNLDKPSETPSKSLDDYEVAEDGEIIIDDWSSLVGDGSDSDVSVGSSGMEDIGQELHDYVESGQAQRDLDEMKSRHPDWTI